MASNSDGLTVAPMVLCQAPQASLMGMPTELLLRIVEEVKNQQDIVSLCYTSRSLLRVAQPELLKSHVAYIQHRHSYTYFLRAITMQPFLGTHIQELHFMLLKRHEPNPCCFDGTDLVYARTYWTDPSGTAPAVAIAPEVEDMEKELHAGLEDNDGEAVLISLLKNLPKLEVLSVWLDGFELGQTPEPRVLANFFKSLAANQEPSRPLVALKAVTFATCYEYCFNWMPLWEVLNWFGERQGAHLPWAGKKKLLLCHHLNNGRWNYVLPRKDDSGRVSCGSSEVRTAGRDEDS